MQKGNTANKEIAAAMQVASAQGQRHLSRKQERAISELLNPDNKDIEHAAEKAGVRPNTLRAWFYEPDFQERLQYEREKLLEDAVSSLKTHFSRAVDVLGEILNSGSESAKLKACQMILDYGGAKEIEKKPRKSEPEPEGISFEELIEKLKRELWGMR